MRFALLLCVAVSYTVFPALALVCGSNHRQISVAVSGNASPSFRWEFSNIDNPLNAVITHIGAGSGSSQFCVPCGSEYSLVVNSFSTEYQGTFTAKLDSYTINTWDLKTTEFGVQMIDAVCLTAAPTHYSCVDPNQCVVAVALDAQANPAEVRWAVSRISDPTGLVETSTQSSYDMCVDAGYYSFTIADQGTTGDYELFLDWDTLQNRSTPGGIEGKTFQCVEKFATVPTPAPTVLTCDIDSNPMVTIAFDNVVNASETIWSIINKNGVTLVEQFGAVGNSLCLPCGDSNLYTFRITDFGSDGLGGGSFSVTRDLITIIPNSSFNYSFIQFFSVRCGLVESPSTSPSGSPTAQPITPITANPTFSPTSSPSRAPSLSPTQMCQYPSRRLDVYTIISGSNLESYSYRVYGLGQGNTYNENIPRAKTSAFCLKEGFFVVDFVAPSGDSTSSYRVTLDDVQVCTGTFDSDESCLITVAATKSPSISPSIQPSNSPTASFSLSTPPPITCQPGEKTVYFSTNRQSFTWSWVALNPFKLYSGDESTRSVCVVNGSTNTIVLQSNFAPLDYTVDVDSDSKTGSVNAKTATLTYPF